MYGDAPVSPMQYLSAKQSLKRSRLSPLQDAVSIRSVADEMHKSRPTTALPAQQILESLFAFILERAQQEVVVTFFEHLLDKKIPQVGWIFPHVREQYSNPQFTYSQSFLASLREAFFLDLQNLNVSLPELLLNDDYFGDLQQDPIFYNLLTVYAMFGLSAQEGASLGEVLPLTHRDLFQRYEAAGDNLNRYLADSAYTTAEYLRVIETSSAFMDQLNRVFDQLRRVETASNDGFTSLFFQGDTAIPDRSRYINDSLYTYAVLIGNADQRSVFDLGFVPQLLAGALDEQKFTRYNTLDKYDQFFDPPHTPQQLRIAGLELARNLSGVWYNDLNIIEILRRWQTGVAGYEQAIDQRLAVQTASNIDSATQIIEQQRFALNSVIGETRNFWASRAAAGDLQAMDLLNVLASDFAGIPSGLAPQDMLQRRRDKMFQIEQRLVAIERRLGADPKSPLNVYLKSKQAAKPSAAVIPEIDSLGQLLQQLQLDLARLDTARAPKLAIARKQPRPLLQVTELLSHLFYALRSDDQWIKPDSFKLALNDPQLRSACLGLLQQRLRRVQGVSVLAPDATAEFVTLTLDDLWSLKEPGPADTTDQKKQADDRLFTRTTIALRTFNRALQFPLFADPKKPGAYLSLTALNTKLRSLPGISEQCMNFLYYLQIGEHRPAVGSLLRLMTSLSKQIDQKNPSSKRAKMLRFFEEYGDFIAGMVDAKTKAEVEYLLKSLADPPGSSRIKRTKAMSVGLNAYLGASVGQDSWQRRESDPTTEFTSFAPSIPIGFTYSLLLGRKNKHPQSFSVFVGVLDLGAMLSYRLGDESEFGSDKLDFKNVLKPGVQLHWNIQKTPFYLGTGWQTGAQYRQENGQEISFRASRWMFLVFGVDVPVKTMYRR